MTRRADTVRIEVSQDAQGNPARHVMDNFTSLSITNDITAPSEAAFEMGDDGTFAEIEQLILPGALYRVYIDDRLRLTGRVEVADIPFDAAGSAVSRFTIRTKLADAHYASADPKTRVKGASIKEFLVALFAPLGYTESDFILDPSTARNLMTGQAGAGQGAPTTVDLEPLKEEQAKVQPGEAIFEAADRHLRRHGLMLWDAPDGRIVVGFPNDTQDPIFHFRMFRGPDGQFNNVLSARRLFDWTAVPSLIGVFGAGGKADFTKSKVSAIVENAEVVRAGFYRPVLILAEGLKTQGLAQHAALRENSVRRRNQDCWEIEVDGLSHWSGSALIPFGVDVTADVLCDVAGGPLGAYYIHRVSSTRDAQSGDRTSLTMLRRGLWTI